MTDKNCKLCLGTGWVCENHLEVPAGTKTGQCDCGAACNCLCNPNGEVEWEAVYASTEPSTVKDWIQ